MHCFLLHGKKCSGTKRVGYAVCLEQKSSAELCCTAAPPHQKPLLSLLHQRELYTQALQLAQAAFPASWLNCAGWSGFLPWQ